MKSPVLAAIALHLPLLLNAQTSLRDAPGKQAVQRICSGCHTLDIVTSARQTRDRWKNIAQDMVARGAQGSPVDLETVVDYLAANYGKTGASPAASPAAAPPTAPAAPKLDTAKQISRADQWPLYGHDPGGQRFSPLRQITPANVIHLQRAWTFHLGKAGSEATPLVIDSVMYVTAPDAIFALEPETGKILWKYPSRGVARRGLAYWEAPGLSPRIFCGVETGKMVALDAKTGQPVNNFGDNGLIDLKRGVADNLPNARFFLASPPAIFKNVIITGGNNGELSPSQGAYGDVRGWDARTGKLLWTFHTVPRPGEPGNETWAESAKGAAAQRQGAKEFASPLGGALDTAPVLRLFSESWKQRSGTNVWGIMTVDTQRGTVYLPIGCPTSDMYGADRLGNGLYGNSLVALDALNGRVKWYRQLVHHDLWDYDLAAPPILIDVVRDGKTIPAVAQITKMSLVFIFDRTTGEPIFGLEERPVPTSHVPGEQSSPTQPFPLKPPPLAKTSFEQNDLYDLTPDHAQFCLDLLNRNNLVNQGPYTPMPTEGNGLTFPSTLGGGNWGGFSYNPDLGYLFTSVMNLGQWGHMEQKTDPATGETTYARVGGASGAYARFWDPQNHIPCTKPPFGELVAVNAKTGDIAWHVPLGSVPELEAKGITHTGSPAMGGSIATASGLVFIAATNDARIRAFEAQTGKELWTSPLDTSAYTVPVTYQGRDGRQYVVVVAGGTGFFASPPGDSIIAFALP